MTSDTDILSGCVRQQPKAQRELFDKYGASLLGICMRYAASREEAEDVLQEGFVKIFNNITAFKGEGSLMAWMRRIVINTAITHYHRTLKHRYHSDISVVKEREFDEPYFGESDFTHEELWKVIQSMPDGYRMVFCLYAIDGYKHREIADLMKIDENTSKSQYSRARRWLQERLLAIQKEKTTRPVGETGPL
ncbi:MAG: RNA polymerase sigma factor [Bacteroidota bacterium]